MVSSAFFVFVVALLNSVSALELVRMDEPTLFHLREDFTKATQASDDINHEVVFAVKQRNLDQLESLLFQVSDPKNSKYGQYLSRKEVADLTANPQATQQIVDFLKRHGISEVKSSPFGEYISASAKIGMWEELFGTTFYEFKHENAKSKPVYRANEYSLPKEISQSVETVFNTIHLPNRQRPRMVPTLKESLNLTTSSVTPEFLNTYYNIFSNEGSSLASQALYESLEQYYSPADLSLFESTFNIPSEKIAVDIGGYESDQECIDDSNNCAEANLDVQYMIAVSQNTPTTYWYEGASDSFLAWIQAVAAYTNPPLVNSISYASIEPELPKSVANAFNTEAMKLGVQGVSILASSGDDGVANFQARSNAKKCGYNPSFPASSPYVTAVGATQGPESGNPEIACASNTDGIITTGGGFSTIFPAPSYQSGIISGYFSSLPSSHQPVSGYSTSGRGYPDVSMAGYNYVVVIGGKTYQLSGTSASSPVVAGMVSLVNAARLKAGKKALGFLNTAIYQHGTTFSNDITSGENSCCAQNIKQVCCDQGFYTSKGWDPVTGFGSVDYKKFYDIFNKL